MRLCRDRDSAPSTKLDDVERQEAERKLQELKRRRNDAESEELEKMKQKQQDAEAELEKLKRKREERRKIMEEEERQRKQELEDKKTKEQVRDGFNYINIHIFLSEIVSAIFHGSDRVRKRKSREATNNSSVSFAQQ